MVRLSKLRVWYQYLGQKFVYISLLSSQKCEPRKALPEELWITSMKYMFQERMTYFFRSKGVEMSPTISDQEALVVRKLPCPDAGSREDCELLNVGDVIIMKDPLNSENYMVRRLAALEGYEMVSMKEEDESFVLEDGQCWVLSDNKHLKPKESKDSRTFGPIPMTDIVGRAIYRYRTPEDHGFVVNNKLSMSRDFPVIYAELNISARDQSAEKDKEGKGSQS